MDAETYAYILYRMRLEMLKTLWRMQVKQGREQGLLDSEALDIMQLQRAPKRPQTAIGEATP